MRLILFSASFVCFTNLWTSWTCLGGNYSWECLNDYLFKITCVLNASSEAVRYLELHDDRGPHRCTFVEHAWVCVFPEKLADTDSFTVSVNSSIHGNSMLETDYMPKNHIRPVPPSNLTVLWGGKQAVFHWLSGYDDNTLLVKNLRYELSVQTNDKVWDVPTTDANLTVPVSRFAPSTSYTARVRSAPIQSYYGGVWSHWGPALHWTTAAQREAEYGRHVPDTPPPWGWLAVLWPVLLALVLFAGLYRRWKRCALIPNPVPHVGNIKHLAMAPRIAVDLLQREEFLRIDSMTEDPEPCRYDHSPYELMKSAQPGPPLTPPSPVPLQPPTVLKTSWTQAFTAPEKGGLTCSEGYCTLAHAQ